MPDLRKVTSGSDEADEIRCSFCGRAADDSRDLVAGDEGSICAVCVATCNDLLAEEPSTDRSESDVDADSVEERSESPPQYFRLLTAADVAGLISPDELVDAMEQALRRFSSGEVVQPVRSVLSIGGDGFFGIMPAYAVQPPVVGAKLVTVFHHNTERGLPSHLAAILLFSPDTGALVAVMDGRHITSIRTAAVSAISADLLARDETAVMAIVGSGVQARSHLAALLRVFELDEVRVWSPTVEHQAQFVDEVAPGAGVRVVGVDSAEQAVRGADLVVLVTSSTTPVVESEWIKPGAHVISVGACRPDQREMEPALLQRGRLFVDSRAAALVESGDVVLGIQEGLIRPAHIVGELGELLAEKVEGRRSPRDVTIFKSLGLAIEDIFAADLAYRRAIERNVGLELEL